MASGCHIGKCSLQIYLIIILSAEKKDYQCNIHNCIILQGRIISGVQVYLHSLCRMLLKLSQILCVKVPSKTLSAKEVSNNVSFLFNLLQGVSNESWQGLRTIWNITTEPWLCVTGADVLLFLIVTRHTKQLLLFCDLQEVS